LIGFGYDPICKAKKCLPECSCYWLFAFKPDARNPNPKKVTDDLIEKAISGGLDGLMLLHTGPITPEFMKKARAAGLKIYVWTVDDAAAAHKTIDLGVDGIATNRPGWLREQLQLEVKSPS
jgi:glycerophosphoryl diester phosphodiesterase